MADGANGYLQIESWFGRDIIEEINGKTIRMLNRLGRKVVSRAKSYTPVDTGRLRNSIEFEVADHGESISLTWGSDVPYAVFVEYGTVFMRGHYMFLRAHEEVIEPLSNHFTDEIHTGVDLEF